MMKIKTFQKILPIPKQPQIISSTITPTKIGNAVKNNIKKRYKEGRKMPSFFILKSPTSFLPA